MNIKPNLFQKFIHRFLMMRWVSAFLAVNLHRMDAVMLKLSHGRHTVTEIVGLPIIQITTIGAKSGEPRTMPFNGREQKFIARQTEGEEREKYWQMAVSYYKGYDLYKVRAAHRQIPVIILEPVK